MEVGSSHTTHTPLTLPGTEALCCGACPVGAKKQQRTTPRAKKGTCRVSPSSIGCTYIQKETGGSQTMYGCVSHHQPANTTDRPQTHHTGSGPDTVGLVGMHREVAWRCCWAVVVGAVSCSQGQTISLARETESGEDADAASSSAQQLQAPLVLNPTHSTAATDWRDSGYRHSTAQQPVGPHRAHGLGPYRTLTVNHGMGYSMRGNSPRQARRGRDRHVRIIRINISLENIPNPKRMGL